MSIRYHGKYCGPGWSAGKYQQSVNSRVPPTDEFDKTCQIHDGAYAHPTNSKARSKADDEFYKQNIGKGPKRAIAALAVKATSKIMRAHEANPTGVRFRKQKSAIRGKHLRGSKLEPSKRSAVSRAQARLNQRNRLTPMGHLINSITSNELVKTPSQTMPRKFKTNNTTSKAAVATSKTVRITAPKMKVNNKITTVTHREYVGQVNSSTTTAISSRNINPGLGQTFNWLPDVAGGYEEYRFRKLTFTYVSAAATSERGRVSLAFQYDPTADNPTSRAGLFAIVPNVEEAPWEDIVLRVPCNNEFKYIRRGIQVTGTVNTYDMGKVHVLTAMNADSTTQLGELFVEYVVELKNPQFHAAPAGELRSDTPTATFPCGTDDPFSITSGQSTLARRDGVSFWLNTTRPMLITIRYIGTVLNQTNPTYTQSTGSNGSLNVKADTIDAAATEQVTIFTVKNTEYGDYITLGQLDSTTLTSVIFMQGVFVGA